MVVEVLASPMNDRKVRFPNLVEVVIIGLICGLLFGCLWTIGRDSRGLSGDPIPSQPPNEASRVHHPTGFSIVVPPNWGSHISGSFLMAPLSPGRSARRSKALVVVSYLGDKRPPELEGLKRITFFGQEAYEGMKVVRRWTFDDGAWSEYYLYLRHGEAWYLVKYGIAAERSILPDMIRQYINTLSWDEMRSGPTLDPILPSPRQ
jgi:hypothetical protein